jgi:hypothetical protein
VRTVIYYAVALDFREPVLIYMLYLGVVGKNKKRRITDGVVLGLRFVGTSMGFRII